MAGVETIVAAAAAEGASDADVRALADACKAHPDEVRAAIDGNAEWPSTLVYERALSGSADAPRLLAALVETQSVQVLERVTRPRAFHFFLDTPNALRHLLGAMERAGKLSDVVPGLTAAARTHFETMVGGRDRGWGEQSLDADVQLLARALAPAPATMRPLILRAVREAAQQAADLGRHTADVWDMCDRVIKALG